MGALDCVALTEDFVMILFTLDPSEKQLPGLSNASPEQFEPTELLEPKSEG